MFRFIWTSSASLFISGSLNRGPSSDMESADLNDVCSQVRGWRSGGRGEEEVK